MAVSKPRLAEETLLLDCHRELTRRHDHAGAEEVVDLLTSMVACEELATAVEHDDREAMAFHASLVLRSLEFGPASYL
ncbi:hypothetical protein ACFWNN_08130 [Lentzea sp. NPDC058450]|uniref:hypothetical protein n=1 Tax=Lentzea sp. NPDC058450 TaxID=3346505 RepID=UPI003649F13C